jgi:hypothetical protein
VGANVRNAASAPIVIAPNIDLPSHYKVKFSVHCYL